MGKMKNTLPDYPTVAYEYDESYNDGELRMWAMEQAIRLQKRDCTYQVYAESVRLQAQFLMDELRKLK